MSQAMYDQDLYRWATETAGLIRDRRFAEIDALHLAEELESMGKSERRALESRLVVLLVHLLKWRHQPERCSKSWRRTLIEQRKQIAKLLHDSPSLNAQLPELTVDAYDSAVRWAADETGMDESDFPPTCEYSVRQLLDADYDPAASASGSSTSG